MAHIARTVPLFLVLWLCVALVHKSQNVAVLADDKNAGGQEQRNKRGFHVVGYLPDYRAANVDPDVGKYLTDLIYFSASPDPSGDVNFESLKPENIQMLRKMKQRHHVALLVCIGGWERSARTPTTIRRCCGPCGVLQTVREPVSDVSNGAGDQDRGRSNTTIARHKLNN
jgi:hypothetical protein